MVADNNDGSTSTGMKQYHVQTFGIINGVNSVYGLGTKSDGTGYKLFKKSTMTSPSWAALSGTLTEGTDTMVPGVLQASVGSEQFLYFFVGDKMRVLNYNAGTEYVNPSKDFSDTTTNVTEGVVAKDQNAYAGRNNSIIKLTAPGSTQTFTVTIASPGVFSATAHGLVAGSRVRFTTTGALPTGLTAGTEYYVISAGLTADAFEVSTTSGGSAVNTSGSQSGVHTLYKPPGATTQLSVPATHEIASIDNYNNYLAFAARPITSSVIQSSKNPGTTADSNAVGIFAWLNASNIASSDNAYATAQNIGTFEYLVVAGGGAGGFSGSNDPGAGGGAGGLIYSAAATLAVGAYPITIGAGGVGSSSRSVQGANGGDTTFNGLTAIGGGAGGNSNRSAGTTAANGQNGGSGGGAGLKSSGSGTAGTGTSGQGFDGSTYNTVGHAGGGGGSSAAAATNSDNGGAGTAYTISGASVTYARGGGSGQSSDANVSGTANSGNGGGGAFNANGTTGGSGVVIIRYLTNAYGSCTGGTITTDGLYTVHTFTSNGTFTVVAASSTLTHYLKATNFGFAIPVGATINGIEVQIEKKSTLGTITDSSVKIVKADGSIGSTNKALGTTWPTSDTTFSYGGSQDLWGETWAYTDINDSDFGVVLSVSLPMGETASVDYVKIIVNYTTAPASYPNLNSYLYIWDLVSADVQETIGMGPGKLDVICNVGGVILGVTEEYLSDSFGNDKGKIIIRGWSGGESQILKEIPAQASGGSLAKWKAIKGGRIYFYAKIATDTAGSIYREGIWSFGRKDTNSPWALAIEVDTTQFASTVEGFRFIGNFLQIAHSTDGSISRSDDTETYAYTSTYISQRFERNYECQLKSVELTTEALPSGASAVVKIRQNAETNWTTLFTMNTANATFDLRSRLASGEDFAKFHTMQFRIDSTGGAEIVKLRARYITMNDETENE